MRVHFTKMQGAGNDFVVLDETAAQLGLSADQYRFLANRHFGVGADQILTCAGRWFDKPRNRAEARAQLGELAGRRHELATAVVAFLGGARVWHHLAVPRLWLRPCSPEFLDAYLDATDEGVLESVGAYQIERLGAQLFARIEGDHFAVLGLPLLPLLEFLREQGVLLR